MPYPNEHSARLRDPKDFDADSFRRKSGGTIYGSKKVPATIGIVWGKLKGKPGADDQPLPQALRFPTKAWTVTEAKSWLKDNEIQYKMFEPAQEADAMPEDGIERRSLAGIELRDDDEGRAKTIVGYAAVFNKLSEDLGGFRERIASGAFRQTLADGADVRALLNHDPSQILGRSKADTLRVAEDDKGLHVEIDIPDTTLGRDTATSIKRRDLDGMSFGFRTVEDRWAKEGSRNIRTLEVAELLDVSVVTYPAYRQTSVAVRGLETVVDIARLNEVLVRADRQLGLEDEDISAVREMIGRLEGLLPETPRLEKAKKRLLEIPGIAEFLENRFDSCQKMV